MKLPVFLIGVFLVLAPACEKKSKGEKLLDDISDHSKQTAKDVDKATKQVVEDSEKEGKKSKSQLDKLFKK